MEKTITENKTKNVKKPDWMTDKEFDETIKSLSVGELFSQCEKIQPTTLKSYAAVKIPLARVQRIINTAANRTDVEAIAKALTETPPTFQRDSALVSQKAKRKS